MTIIIKKNCERNEFTKAAVLYIKESSTYELLDTEY
jgi:hypothetical protein